MTVGLDIDGTITRCPEFFAIMAAALIESGHRVIIITYREDRAATEAELKKWRIPYSRLITSALAETIEAGVDEWKAEVCRAVGVDVFFDDSEAVLRHVDRSAVRILMVNAEE